MGGRQRAYIGGMLRLAAVVLLMLALPAKEQFEKIGSGS